MQPLYLRSKLLIQTGPREAGNTLIRTGNTKYQLVGATWLEKSRVLFSFPFFKPLTFTVGSSIVHLLCWRLLTSTSSCHKFVLVLFSPKNFHCHNSFGVSFSTVDSCQSDTPADSAALSLSLGQPQCKQQQQRKFLPPAFTWMKHLPKAPCGNRLCCPQLDGICSGNSAFSLGSASFADSAFL